jgi:aspartate aminotransferase
MTRLEQELRKHTLDSNYASALGIEPLRVAVASFYDRVFQVKRKPEQVVVGLGTKMLVYMLLQILEGDVVIPTPAWIGYAPQAGLLGRAWHPFPLKKEDGYRIEAEALEHYLTSLPPCQHLLIINNPNNPTGILYTNDELEQIVDVCRRNNTLILADEIYALTSYQYQDFVSLGKLYPEGTFVTGGLSKDRSAGGYRLGVALMPEESDAELVDAFEKLAATIYSSIPTPIQWAAIAAYEDYPSDDLYYDRIRNIHRIMGTTLSEMCNRVDGLNATIPQGGFYYYLDFQELKAKLSSKGIKTSNQLGKALLAHPYHIATVTGDAIMLPPGSFGARIAFVDYGGGAAYEQYERHTPRNKREEIQFVRDMAPKMIEGVEAIKQFVMDLDR